MHLAAFECELCDSKHELYVESEDDEPDERWPMGWLLMRTKAVGFATDYEHVFCDNCRDKVLKVLGYKTFEAYTAVVKAQAEMEQEQARKAQEESRRNVRALQQQAYLAHHTPSEGNDLN
jgi:hypothetical protein